MTLNSQYIAQKPSKNNRYEVQRLLTFSVSQAYTIAGEDDPGVALLDLITMVILGRIFFEEEGSKRYGIRFFPIIRGFKRAEKDIMQIIDDFLKENKCIKQEGQLLIMYLYFQISKFYAMLLFFMLRTATIVLLMP